jgi:hypothetical protein
MMPSAVAEQHSKCMAGTENSPAARVQRKPDLQHRGRHPRAKCGDSRCYSNTRAHPHPTKIKSMAHAGCTHPRSERGRLSRYLAS